MDKKTRPWWDETGTRFSWMELNWHQTGGGGGGRETCHFEVNKGPKNLSESRKIRPQSLSTLKGTIRHPATGYPGW